MANRTFRSLAILICLAVLGTVIVACTTGSGPAKGADQPKAAGSTPVNVGQAAHLQVGTALTVDLPAESFSGSGTLQGATIASPGPAPTGLLPLGPAYEITLAGATLTGPVGVSMPNPRRPTAVRDGPDAVLLCFYDEAGHAWVPVDSTYDKSTGTLTAQLPHLSKYALFGLDTEKFMRDASSALNGLFNLADAATQPQCDGHDQLDAQHVTVTSDSGSIVKWCAGVDRNGSAALTLADNRNYALETDYPATWKMQRLGDPDPVFERLSNVISERLSPTSRGVRPVIVQGGKSIRLTAPAGSSGVARTDPSAAAYLVSAFGYGLDTLAKTYSEVPGARAPDPSTTDKLISLAFDSKSCVTSLDELTHADISNAHAAGELFRKDIDLALGCLGPQWKKAYGPTGAVGAFFADLIFWLTDGVNLVVDGVQAAIESAIYWRSYRIAVQYAAPSLGAIVGDWQRHSTIFTIKADGTGETHERTYTPCGTTQDCAFNARLKVIAQPGGGGLITYTSVSYTDESNKVMQLSAADHHQLDPYFFLPGEQAKATVDSAGRLVLTPLGRLRTQGERSPDGYTYCGPGTKPGENGPCGA